MVIQDFYPITGGAEKQCLKLSKALIASGVDVTVVTRRTTAELEKECLVEGVQVIRLKCRKPFEWASLVWLFYLIKNRSQFDLLHVHMLHEHTFGSIVAGRLFNKPVILKAVSSGYDFDLLRLKKNGRRPFNLLIIHATRYVSQVISICSAVQNDLLKWQFPPEIISCIPNGVTLHGAVSDATKKKRRYELGLPESGCIVLRVGSYLPVKGVSVLLDAWVEVARCEKETFLVSVGGEEVPSTVVQFTELYKEQMKTVPNQPDGVLPYYQAADFLVLPSLTEGLSNVLLEAQSCGLPAVVTNVGGNGDIIVDGENGLLVPPGDKDQLASAIVKLVRNKSLRHSMSGASLRRIKSFSMAHVVAKYKELYARLLQK